DVERVDHDGRDAGATATATKELALDQVASTKAIRERPGGRRLGLRHILDRAAVDIAILIAPPAGVGIEIHGDDIASTERTTHRCRHRVAERTIHQPTVVDTN